MQIFYTILICLLYVLLFILLILIIFVLIPFKYSFFVEYKNNELDIKFNYIIFPFSAKVSFENPIRYYGKLWNKTLFDSENNKESDKENNSIADTDFIQNKDLDKEIKHDKNIIRDLFVSAKKQEKVVAKESKALKSKNSSLSKNLIDKSKKLIPYDMWYVVNLIYNEALKVLNQIKPIDFKADLTYGAVDPYVTGMMMAALSPVYAFLGDDINIKSKFNEEIIEGSISAHGKPIVLKILIPAGRVFLDKKFRKIFFKKKSK